VSAVSHVLIVPSEEFLPPNNHLSGMFQLHQAETLLDVGLKVGVLSVHQAHSIPMFIRAGLMRVIRQKPGNALDEVPLRELGRQLIRKTFLPSAVELDSTHAIPVIRAEGFYYLPPSPRTRHFGWVRAGLAAFDAYTSRFGRPDVVHAHNLDPAGLLAERIFHKRGVPFVVTEHSSTYFERGLVDRSVYSRLARAARSSKGVAAVSPALASVLVRELDLEDVQIRIIPNVVEKLFLDAPLASESPLAGFRFLSVGNLVPVKAHDLLINAFARAFRGNWEVTLRIAGDGPSRGMLADLILRLDLSSQVSLAGRLSREGILNEIDRCDSLVLPSEHETFGVVLIEALSRGKPVVATECGGPESFIEAADGILVRPRDVDALAAGLTRMVTERDSYRDETRRDRTISRFGPETLRRSLTELYAEALTSRSERTIP